MVLIPLPRSLLLPLSLLVFIESIASATTTFTIQPNDTRSTISDCGPSCSLSYTVASVTWESTISTILAYGDADSVAWTKSIYYSFYEQYSPQLIPGTVATDWRVPDFTATCCDDVYYISSGVTAQYGTEIAETCEPTEAIFTGRRVATVQDAFPTTLPFLEHDCGVSSTVIKTILTQITVLAANPNPPTGTADGQSTWWEDGSDEITILLPPTPTPYFTILPCPVSGTSCYWSVGTMNLEWEASTITISGNASELSSLEASLSTSINDVVDWVNATGGWGQGVGASATCCSESIWLDNVVTIDYGGYCPTTVLTGFNQILPVSIAYAFVNGTEANCNINIGGGIASTKTAIYVEKVTADVVGPGVSTTTPPATKEPDTVPTSTSTVVTKETGVVDSSSRTTRRTTPRTTPRTTQRTTPRTTPRTTSQAGPQTTPRRSTTASSRQALPVESPQPESSRSSQLPDNSQLPVIPPTSSETTNPPNNSPDNPLNTQSNNTPNTLPNNPPNQTNNPTTNPSAPPNNNPQGPIDPDIPPRTNPPPNDIPVIPGTLAPEPSLSTIFTSIPTVITSTDASGSQTVISTFTNSPIGTAVNIITTDDAGNTITSRFTFSNPTGTGVEEQPVAETQNPLPPGATSRTTILTLTSRVGSGITVETRTSVIVEVPTSETGTNPTTGGQPGSETETSGPDATSSPSDAVSQKGIPYLTLIIVGLVSLLHLV